MKLNLRKELLQAVVEKPHTFNSQFAVVTHIRDYETTEDEVLDWLAHEVQTLNRGNVVRRLHQRYNRLRLQRERKELGLDE